MLMIHFKHCLIDSEHEMKISTNKYINTNKYLLTHETLAMGDDKILLGDPDGM